MVARNLSPGCRGIVFSCWSLHIYEQHKSYAGNCHQTLPCNARMKEQHTRAMPLSWGKWSLVWPTWLSVGVFVDRYQSFSIWCLRKISQPSRLSAGIFVQINSNWSDDHPWFPIIYFYMWPYCQYRLPGKFDFNQIMYWQYIWHDKFRKKILIWLSES